MELINLKEKYSDYYIRIWKKQGLRLITERPPTTTQILFDDFFKNRKSIRKYQNKAIRAERQKKKRLEYKDYLREEYK